MSLHTKMSVSVGGVTFPNPFIAASGTFGYGDDYEPLYPVNIWGGISCKGTTLNKRQGNLPPRIAETPSGMLNSVGLQNCGIDDFIEKLLPSLKSRANVVIANLAGEKIEDYVESAAKLDKSAVDMVELNISCPNVKQGGLSFGVSTQATAAITKAVRAATSKPLMVKLSPNVTDITEIAKAAQSEGANALSLINTLLGMRIDIKTRRPILRNNVGGLSGPAVLPVAVRMVWQVARAVDIDIVGMGGISCLNDALEFLIAGAKAVQIGTALFTDPHLPTKIPSELEQYMKENKLNSITQITGTVEPW
ncbi:MAG: dihydroorotate dehydrogenase [Oscillospiraceae bacterium]|nr:dihydroorotate dehydrogenase [Oscillospiraceae bacterium]